MKLYAPGPIRVPDKIKQTFLSDPPYFASKQFYELIATIKPLLQRVFKSGNYPVLIGCGSGSLGLQSSVRNFFRPSDTVVVVGDGKYSKLVADMCFRNNLYVKQLVPEFPGGVVNPEDLKIVLRSIGKVKGVFLIHVETTYGLLNPIEEYRKIIREHDESTLIVLDAVSSLLTEQLQSSKYDVVVSASQKALSLPPGLFFMSVSYKAVSKCINSPEVYFDVMEEVCRWHKCITTFTPASYLYPALELSLKTILDIGVDNVIKRSSDVSQTVRDLLISGFELFPVVPCNAVTAVVTNDDGRLFSKLLNNDIIVGNGVGNLSGRIIRLMHFGWDLDLSELSEIVQNMLIWR